MFDDSAAANSWSSFVQSGFPSTGSRSRQRESPHHLYLLSAGADELRRHLAFRDALRASSDLRTSYGALKRSLAEAHRNDRCSYTKGKAAFIASVVGID